VEVTSQTITRGFTRFMKEAGGALHHQDSRFFFYALFSKEGLLMLGIELQFPSNGSRLSLDNLADLISEKVANRVALHLKQTVVAATNGWGCRAEGYECGGCGETPRHRPVNGVAIH